ncbi:prevent-host-death protein [Hydrogenophaga sp. D2P1]|uniref:Prevent-host-death protein n=1 Tax=Hydrogenophaga aromaticivorans TaxID=2610898 RepID=A0A7Y8L072_9BURK|nr:prevent-host-death protein [Hydrogenophaga aromaticivorans]NWF48061.1 prevent-host-death protein [Hydrogenophaga aromaticivorans]
MIFYTGNQAQPRLEEFLDQVQHEAMRNFYTNRLQDTLAQNAASAAAKGLTEDGLQRLLDDES